jgi:hypothetical protein
MKSVARILILTLLACTNAIAVDWEDLSAAERGVLTPFAGQWQELSPQTQADLQKGARRWSTMSPGERRHAQNRQQHWSGLPAEQQARIRERYDSFRALPPEQQRSLRQSHQRFKALPKQRQNDLRRRFQTMSPDERRAFLQGMHTERQGRKATDQRRQSDVADPQRRALRELAAGLSQASRQNMMRLLREASPAESDQLQQELSEMSLQQRDEYLGSAVERDRDR